jgi:hypothetical protein
MRTTPDIDEDVLEAAEELAERQNKTPGQVISELVRRGVLCTNMHSDQKPLPRIDRLVTNALVKRIQEEIEEEEVRRANGLK